MLAWLGRKSHKSKEQQQEHHHSFNKASIKDKKKKKDKEKAKSFDEVSVILTRNSARTSKDFGVIAGGVGGSTEFLGFDSDGCGLIGEKRDLPLPRPSVSSPPSFGIDHGVSLVSGSVSVSSDSSSGSSDDPPPDHGLFGVYRAQTISGMGSDYGDCSIFDIKAHGEIKFNPRSRSPGPGSRPSTSPPSPIHPRLCGMNLVESPTGKNEGARSPCHPLPLPPTSPTRPSALHTTRITGATENPQCLRSKWKKGRLLGRGTFGHVYLGFNSESGQMCAIKEVKVISDDQTSKESLKQLNQEITLLSQLSQPNIVQYYGSEMGEETLSVYLEYVSGGSIHKLLQEYGPFKEPVIQNYTRQILSGLAYLHGRNTVHRDIKGANILVDPNGDIKLADFGMAKHITSYCSMLSFKGSPYWMAPEVIMNTSGYNLPVDIWSLGCTILEMATSKPPWSQYEGVAAIFKIGNSKDIPEIPDHLSNDAKNFVMLCLQRDPSARPTAAQLLDHPFIRDQARSKVAKVNITNYALPSSSHGNHSQTASEFHSDRMSITPHTGDYGMKPKVTSSRALNTSRDSVRLIMSLPVSPCSSPLRRYEPAHRSLFLSPSHPESLLVGQNGYGLNDYSVLSSMPHINYPADPWRDIHPIKAQTPSGSPRTRPI
ncbi:hypothetical protein HHK36_030478 [Tetracentron sinense]|uniref:mitogen-activated protein kinase kinase kinase n=1 Tax=Tetracentron sinense TaxID=13715 RepID=A0A834YB58_TETSI|nr:hypothetical protein HHK36_030478 [Tetracentron sinense]